MQVSLIAFRPRRAPLRVAAKQLLQDCFGSFEIEPKAHFAQTCFG
jgi:hypothetical protein